MAVGVIGAGSAVGEKADILRVAPDQQQGQGLCDEELGEAQDDQGLPPAHVQHHLAAHKCARYITYRVETGVLDFRIDRAEYSQQRRYDGIFVLETNHPELSAEEVVASYRQLMEVERAFRVLKSLVKLRPIYHHRDRRVEAHVFICFLAYLVAKLMEQRLRRAGLSHSVAHAIEILSRLKAVEHTWEDQALVVKATKPDPEMAAILAALGLRIGNPVLSVAKALPPVA